MYYFSDCPEREYDNRSLFERLEEQKQKRELEYEEAHKLSKLPSTIELGTYTMPYFALLHLKLYYIRK
jgi:hypothetical protein